MNMREEEAGVGEIKGEQLPETPAVLPESHI
jgi:hypothetical protein